MLTTSTRGRCHVYHGQVTQLAPSAIYRTWFPAMVVLPPDIEPSQPPGHTRIAFPRNVNAQVILYKAKVFATDTGLIVYTQAMLPNPTFESPILLDKTATPGTDYASEQRGHVIHTEAGAVTVTKQNACSTCGLTRLFNHRPVWSLAEKTWGA